MTARTATNGRANGKPAAKKPADPYDFDAEVGVLGSAILMPESLDTISDIISPSDFYDSAHEKLYGHLLAQYEERRLFDLTLLTDRIKSAGDFDAIGKTAYLMKIVHAVPNAAHAVHYAEIVRDKAIYRRLIRAATATLQDAYDQAAPPADLVGQAETALARVSDSTIRGRDTQPFNDVIQEAIGRLDERATSGRPRLLHVGLDAFRDCMGLVPGGLTIIGGRPSQGKCLGLGTLVLMNDGTARPVETIKVGDRVMGPDSLPRTVLSTTTGRDAMYRIDQAHSMSYRANGAHILMLKRIKTEKLQKRGTIRQMTVDDVLRQAPSFLGRWHGYKVGVEYPHAEQPVEPYFLGLWLGDGTASNASITSADSEVEEYLRRYAEKRGQYLSVHQLPRGNKAKTLTIVQRRRDCKWSMVSTLRRLSLIGNKHIPRAYLVASRDQRLQLLAGLVDSDGHYSTGNNGFDITMADRLLIDNIKTLADGLGFRTKVRYKRATCQTGDVCDSWRLMISGAIENIPVRLPRKRPTRKFGGACNREATTNRLTITPDGVDDYYGFTLDGDGQFLLADGTVTHNTSVAVRIAANVCQDGLSVYFASLEMTAVELADRMLAAHARVDCYNMISGRLAPEDRSRLVDSASIASRWRLAIDDSPSMTLAHISAAARRVRRRAERLDLIIVDYAQLIEPENRRDDRVEQLAKISRGSKRLAREMECPVILIAQVNRDTNQNADNRPRLHNLKGSGDFEQDADSVIFTHRPKWYLRQFPARGEGEDAELMVVKNRNGPLGDFETLFFGSWMDWQNKASAEQRAAATGERETHF